MRKGLWRSGSKAALVALATVFLLVSVGAPSQALLTKVSVSEVVFDPKTPNPGDIVTATVSIGNTHTSDVKVKWIGVHFDWQSPNSYVFEDHAATPIVIPSQGIRSFTFLVSIPAEANISSHSYYFRIDYESQGSSYSEKSDTYYDLVIVKPRDDVETPIWESPAFIAVIIVFVVLAVVGISGILIRKRRMEAELARKRLDLITTSSTGATPEEVELAKTVVKGRTPPQTQQAGHWNPPPSQRHVGQAPIYNLLQGKGSQDGPQPMPMAPPTASGPTAMPQSPPPNGQPYLQQPRGMPPSPPPLPPPVIPKEQTKISQCPICGKMIRAHDTSCPGCGGKL